ncbi:MAG: hypothetical protein HYS13_02010 [Planctomycetia bacterium]|nr:hypothetical protein [Planctomycetia bacterium]
MDGDLLPPVYDPPFDSPIEDAFAGALVKYLRGGVALKKQVEVATICGRFRLDFVAVSRTGHRVAYECDGSEFHDQSRDEWRDAMILGAGAIDAIVRCRGIDITHRLDDVLFIASRWDAELFSDRGSRILSKLASKRAKLFDAAREPSFALISYPDPSHQGIEPFFLAMHRRTLRSPPGVRRQFWQSAFELAKAEGGGELNSVIERCRARSPTCEIAL